MTRTPAPRCAIIARMQDAFVTARGRRRGDRRGRRAVRRRRRAGTRYREIGKGGLDAPAADDAPRPRPPRRTTATRRSASCSKPATPGARAAASRRWTSTQQLAALTAPPPAHDELRDELRALVEARNRRRVRAGLEPLDVDAEVERRLRDLN